MYIENVLSNEKKDDLDDIFCFVYTLKEMTKCRRHLFKKFFFNENQMPSNKEFIFNRRAFNNTCVCVYSV